MAKSKTQDKKRSQYRVGDKVWHKMFGMITLGPRIDAWTWHAKTSAGTRVPISESLLRPLTVREKGKD